MGEACRCFVSAVSCVVVDAKRCTLTTYSAIAIPQLHTMDKFVSIDPWPNNIYSKGHQGPISAR